MGEIWILSWEQKVTERQKRLGNRFRDFKKGLVESPNGTDPSQIIMVPFDTLGNVCVCVCVCVCVLTVEKFPVFRPGQKASGMLAFTQKEQAWIGETVSSNWCLNTGGWVLRDLVGLHPASVLSLSGGVGISWLSPQSSVYFRLWKWQSRPENISETGTTNALATELWNENT